MDNAGNGMLYGTFGLGLQIGAAAKAQFGAQEGKINSLVSKTGQGGGVVSAALLNQRLLHFR